MKTKPAFIVLISVWSFFTSCSSNRFSTLVSKDELTTAMNQTWLMIEENDSLSFAKENITLYPCYRMNFPNVDSLNAKRFSKDYYQSESGFIQDIILLKKEGISFYNKSPFYVEQIILYNAEEKQASVIDKNHKTESFLYEGNEIAFGQELMQLLHGKALDCVFTCELPDFSIVEYPVFSDKYAFFFALKDNQLYVVFPNNGIYYPFDDSRSDIIMLQAKDYFNCYWNRITNLKNRN